MWNLLLSFGLLASCVRAEFTQSAFGHSDVDGVPAAFGDFNSDELTDIFLLSENFRTIQVMLGASTEPLLTEGPKCTFKRLGRITSVIPGDFDGDAYMDVMFTVALTTGDRNRLGVYINWGGADSLNCTSEDAPPLIEITGEPVALDYNDDMIIDLFALDKDMKRTYYVFSKDRSPPSPVQVSDDFRDKKCKIPHSHAFLDFNNDFTADLVLSGETGFEIWNGVEDQTEFKYHSEIKYPQDVPLVGQSLFLDIELRGQLNLVLPVCQQESCVGSSSILVYVDGTFRNLHLDLKDPENKLWGFVSPRGGSSVDIFGRETITLRGGDFNMDGYPDLIATLVNAAGDYQTVLLENVACSGPSCQNEALTRTFAVQWHALLPSGKRTIMGAFYDFYQDGILDVVLVQMDDTNQFRTVAHRNALDYDSNFVKVIVLTGLTNSLTPPPKLSPMGRRKKTYGTNLPGPRVAYYTTNQDGYQQNGTSAQIPQSAYFALQLPYSVFGLGRTPNFVDTLQVGMCNRSREWRQLIPNSQMIVVPRPVKEPNHWKAQLFITPSKLIVMSTIALGGTCFVIMLIILVLHVKERREDKQEKLMEAHRFHFDAM